VHKPGLPDGIFSDQKSQFGKIFDGPWMDIWNILRLFGIVFGQFLCCGYLVWFALFWYIASRKIWQPCARPPMRFWQSKLKTSFTGSRYYDTASYNTSAVKLYNTTNNQQVCFWIMF
jgi:hypothetical protein